MKRPTNRTLGILAAGALSVGGAGAAIGVASGGTSAQGRDADLAAALNKNEGTKLTAADVRAAELDVLKTRLGDAVKAGRMTQAQADEMLQRAKDAPKRRAEMEARRAARIAPVAKVLGMTASAIDTEMESGKSLAKLAESKGVSRAALLGAIKEGIAAESKADGVTYTAERLDALAADMADRTGGHAGIGHGGDGAPDFGRAGGFGDWDGVPPIAP